MKGSNKIGLALSGGGFRGLMHLGVLQALEELQMKPACISATSFGGFVGPLYANNIAPKEILKLFQQLKLLPFFRSIPNQKGLLNIHPLGKLLQKHLPNTFEELQLPLTINATDLEKGKSVYFDSGNLIRPLLASACVPIIFKPVTIGSSLLVDGGILNNLPIKPLLSAQCDLIIGCNSNHAGTKPVKHVKDVMERTFNLAINQNVVAQTAKLDILVEPPQMANYQVFAKKQSQEIYDIGYHHTLKLLKAQSIS